MLNTYFIMVTLLYLFLIYFMCVSVSPECMSVHHLWAGTHGDQKRVLNPLGLELQVVISYHVSAGNQIVDFWKEQPVVLKPEPFISLASRLDSKKNYLFSPYMHWCFTCMYVCVRVTSWNYRQL